MGQVWQATDTQLNRQVALKILPDAFADDPDRLARFQREAQVLASLNHPNIAQIHGIEEADGTRALVLELVEGPTLADRIAKGPIPIDEALPIARQIAEALEGAHEAGVIHRDLKPANIKVRDDGTVKVLDFGLAKALETAPVGDPTESPTLTAAATQQGVILGTAAYMSPEQAGGASVDKRADIWSFGAVLFEMLTGQRAFDGETASHVLAAVLKTEPDWSLLPGDLTPSVQKLLKRCLRKQRKLRIPHVEMARFELSDELTHSAEQATPSKAGGSVPGHWWALAVATAALVAAVSGVAVWVSTRPPQTTPIPFVVSAAPNPVPLFGNVAISRDGRTIVYLADVDGESLLYVRSVDRLEGELLDGTRGARNPGLSPDGRWVAFMTLTGQTLSKIQVTGGAVTPIAPMDSHIRGLSWEADGRIVFGTGRPQVGYGRLTLGEVTPSRLRRPDRSWVRPRSITRGPRYSPAGPRYCLQAKKQTPQAPRDRSRSSIFDRAKKRSCSRGARALATCRPVTCCIWSRVRCGQSPSTPVGSRFLVTRFPCSARVSGAMRSARTVPLSMVGDTAQEVPLESHLVQTTRRNVVWFGWIEPAMRWHCRSTPVHTSTFDCHRTRGNSLPRCSTQAIPISLFSMTLSRAT